MQAINCSCSCMYLLMMKIKKSFFPQIYKCIILFLLIWSLLLLWVYYEFHSSNLSSSSSSLSGENSVGNAFNLRNHLSILKKYYPTDVDKSPSSTVKQQLPEFNTSAFADEDQESTYIYLDFPLDDRLFNVDNYKALESILTVYPTAIIRFQLLTSKDVYLHKLGNSISYTHLSKYQKLGYNIKVIPYNVRFKSRTTLMGIEYRQRWLATCCTKCDLRCRRSDRMQPYHVHAYVRLSNLWANGGIFSDLSFFFLGTLNKNVIKYGYFISSHCGNDQQYTEWQQEQQYVQSKRRKDQLTNNGSITADEDLSAAALYSNQDCTTSTLIVINERKSDIILCMLRRYDNPMFLECIHSDHRLGGAECVSDAFANCFKQFDLPNELAVKKSVMSSSSSFKKGLVLLMKKKTKTTSSSSSANDDDDRGVLEAFSTDAFQVKSLLLSHNWTLSNSRRVFWLGSLSWSGSWSHYPYPNGTLLAAASGRIKLRSITDSINGLNQDIIITSSTNRIITCSPYSTNLSVFYETTATLTASSPWMTVDDMPHLLQYSTVTPQIINASSLSSLSSSSTSVPANVIPLSHVDTNISSSSSYSSSYPSSSSYTPRTSYHTGIEERSCAPAVFLVGFMKSASSFLYDALVRHPSILPALCGAQYKETNCYKHDANAAEGEDTYVATTANARPSRLLQRSWCFPFIEPHEQFITVDGTIAYMIDPSIAKTIKEDNPNAKILFLIRHPVERLYSHYRFTYDVFNKLNSTFEDLILPALDRYDKFGVLREMAVAANHSSLMAVDEMIRYYYQQRFQGRSALGSLFMHSIYFPAIHHYIRTFGRGNVKVITSDDLNVNDPIRLHETLDSIFAFIGVCSYPISGLKPTLSNRNSIPLSQQMSSNMYRKLSIFFEPFNTVLSIVAAINMSHWGMKPPSSEMPNRSIERSWFEGGEADEQEKSGYGGIVKHLIPERHSDEDSGYNTTLGMLNTF